ncbi:uncharacterized protein TNCV_4611031 [Trichonephila clavipes]|nr:uncharacterized protein TNCV_4611031 [Trichonephila clavipes]
MLHYVDPERNADKPNLTRTQLATYPSNKLAKEEVAYVGLNRSLKKLCNMWACIILLKAPIHDAADIDEVDISTPVLVDQHAANCLEETVRSFTARQNRCRSSRADVFLFRPLPVFRDVSCLSVHCFQTCINGDLFRCPRAPIAR